ncbi:hypothetical protein ACJMK2_012213 [Sinanodonta woodiana]|uniref:FAD dependent oxidoreductase domain-containing protein n=1 Tax=Sinanodonta woodiana TaxID=1069815 RepID=A0ABD3V7I0_SINWO
MANSTIYDVIVVGAGVEGLYTAYHLAKLKRKTLVLEQFPLPHYRGSSHGQSRITRMAYGDQNFYTVMMKEAYQLIEVLEKESGQQLFIQTGLLCIGNENDPIVRGSAASLQQHGIPYEKFGTKEQKQKFPMMSFPDNFGFVIDRLGGILKADKILQALQTQFKKYGGTLRDEEPVVSIDPGDSVTVQTTKGSYKAKNIILALGPWAPKFLARLGLHLPLQPVRISVCYWKEKTPGQHSADKFPVFLMEGGGGDFTIYGLPAQEYPGLVKICLHNGPRIDPDDRDTVNNNWVMDSIQQYVQKHFPQLHPIPAVVETCIYTNTPDHDFILDRHPKWKNVIIAAGFSGHGFKLSPVVGKVLAELAIGAKPSYDLKPFRIDRFKNTSKL